MLGLVMIQFNLGPLGSNANTVQLCYNGTTGIWMLHMGSNTRINFPLDQLSLGSKTWINFPLDQPSWDQPFGINYPVINYPRTGVKGPRKNSVERLFYEKKDAFLCLGKGEPCVRKEGIIFL